MDAAELRARQAPLKEQYRADPETARIPLRAHGDFRDEPITCTIDGFAGPVRAGLHAAAGGRTDDACSGDMLLEAIAACAGVTLRSVATALDVRLGDIRVSATGYFDIRGTLGVDREAPVGVQDVVVTIRVEGVDETTADRLARMTERYCVVGQSLATPPRIVVETTP
ncbi:peroxiredoxin [Nocardioides baekrokdamisoli]|uniref:Peroxiredoxin n=1 Tax=Nocardioides baekrokdamisoli TaxID=1804624 RepID=A0A3G9IEZ3_9ACTN|nr:OsmC family protein [Nocardioides baekrokdamisoli]BBH16936.1 peroxiredoxin [Nocardioides baekrokdamisoli]